MKFVDFRDRIKQELTDHPQGFTWVQLRDRLQLPYRQPCQNWIARLEAEIGLSRKVRIANSLIWKIDIIDPTASKKLRS